LQLVRRFRFQALFCALAVLVCELVSRPYAGMGVCDDWPYILMTRTLAETGHVVYNGWAAPMLVWQLYLGAAFIKLFGFSYTTVRMSALLVAVALAFLLQRTLVRTGITERNATIGTLALVLSPLYLMLSVTFMTDITGLFAIVICLYGCLRALQAASSRAAIGWLCFAVASNAICGTSRQIAWLGILLMVPSTLWLLRARRRVLLAGGAATVAGVLFILGCMQWLKRQPYSIPEHLLTGIFPVAHTLWELIFTFLDVPFLLLPIAALFLPEIRKSRSRVIAILSALSLGYIFLGSYPSHLRGSFPLEPTLIDWVGIHGIFESIGLRGEPPIFLNRSVQVVLTVASLGGLIGLIASLLRTRGTPPPAAGSSTGVSWKQLGVLLAPFTIVYSLLLIPRATIMLFDRYTLGLLVVALLCLVRYYQDRIQPRLPFASVLLVGILAIYGIVVTHNAFALYRARAAMAAEIRAAGTPDTSVDNGWEYNLGVELQHADHINESTIVVPAHAYVPTPPLPAGTCSMLFFDETPHVHPSTASPSIPTPATAPLPSLPSTTPAGSPPPPEPSTSSTTSHRPSSELRPTLAILKAR
jgi:hypothetical protein